MADAAVSRPDRERWAGLAIVALALLLRLHDLDRIDPWVDEANAILTARLPLGAMFEKFELDSSPPLFFLLLHGWIGLLGDGLAELRGLSVAAGVGLVAAMGWAGRELVSPRAGTFAALFVAVSPVQIFYSQQVRPYALLPLLATLSVVFLARHLRDGGARDRALWLAATVAAIYTHNIAIYLPLVSAALILLSGRAWSDRRTWVACAGVGLLAWLPWAPWFVAQLENRDHYAWFIPVWEHEGPAFLLVKTLRSFSPSAEHAQFFGVTRERWGGLVPWAVAALAAWGAVASARLRDERGAVAAFAPLVFLLVPTFAALLASMVSTPHYVSGRVEQMMLPAFALLVGAGLAALRPAPLAWVASAAIVAVSLAALSDFHPEGERARYVVRKDEKHFVDVQGGDRAIAARIAERWRPGDVIVTTSLTRASLEYQLDRDGRDPVFVSFPRDTAGHLGSQNDARWLADRAALLLEAEEAVAEVRLHLAPDGRLFVVRTRSEVNLPFKPEILARSSGLPVVERLGDYEQTGTGVLVELVVHGAPAP